MAGARTLLRGMVPQESSRVSQPWTVPGVATEYTPVSGMVRWPLLLSSSMLAAAGARPLPFKARTLFSLLSQTRANMSPPTPVDMGSTTFRAAAAAMAASTAVPPSIRMRRPVVAAKGWLVATIPLVARMLDRRESKNMPQFSPYVPGVA